MAISLETGKRTGTLVIVVAVPFALLTRTFPRAAIVSQINQLSSIVAIVKPFKVTNATRTTPMYRLFAITEHALQTSQTFVVRITVSMACWARVKLGAAGPTVLRQTPATVMTKVLIPLVT